MSITLPLKKPIKAHGEEISEITLRDPTTKDIIATGLPMLMIPSADGKSTGIEIRQPVIARYVSLLAAIPMGSVESMTPGDFSACTGAVMGFFGEGDGETTGN